MNGFNTLQMFIGSLGVIALAISVAFATYWVLLGKRHRTAVLVKSPQEVNQGTRLVRPGN